MTETKRHCDTCKYSYYTKDREWPPKMRKARQHCSNPKYNSESYTSEMCLEDWGQGYCRFWTPKNERKVS